MTDQVKYDTLVLVLRCIIEAFDYENNFKFWIDSKVHNKILEKILGSTKHAKYFTKTKNKNTVNIYVDGKPPAKDKKYIYICSLIDLPESFIYYNIGLYTFLSHTLVGCLVLPVDEDQMTYTEDDVIGYKDSVVAEELYKMKEMQLNYISKQVYMLFGTHADDVKNILLEYMPKNIPVNTSKSQYKEPSLTQVARPSSMPAFKPAYSSHSAHASSYPIRVSNALRRLSEDTRSYPIYPFIPGASTERSNLSYIGDDKGTQTHASVGTDTSADYTQETAEIKRKPLPITVSARESSVNTYKGYTQEDDKIKRKHLLYEKESSMSRPSQREYDREDAEIKRKPLLNEHEASLQVKKGEPASLHNREGSLQVKKGEPASLHSRQGSLPAASLSDTDESSYPPVPFNTSVTRIGSDGSIVSRSTGPLAPNNSFIEPAPSFRSANSDSFVPVWGTRPPETDDQTIYTNRVSTQGSIENNKEYDPVPPFRSANSDSFVSDLRTRSRETDDQTIYTNRMSAQGSIENNKEYDPVPPFRSDSQLSRATGSTQSMPAEHDPSVRMSAEELALATRDGTVLRAKAEDLKVKIQDALHDHKSQENELRRMIKELRAEAIDSTNELRELRKALHAEKHTSKYVKEKEYHISNKYKVCVDNEHRLKQELSDLIDRNKRKEQDLDDRHRKLLQELDDHKRALRDKYEEDRREMIAREREHQDKYEERIREERRLKEQALDDKDRQWQERLTREIEIYREPKESRVNNFIFKEGLDSINHLLDKLSDDIRNMKDRPPPDTYIKDYLRDILNKLNNLPASNVNSDVTHLNDKVDTIRKDITRLTDVSNDAMSTLLRELMVNKDELHRLRSHISDTMTNNRNDPLLSKVDDHAKMIDKLTDIVNRLSHTPDSNRQVIDAIHELRRSKRDDDMNIHLSAIANAQSPMSSDVVNRLVNEVKGNSDYLRELRAKINELTDTSGLLNKLDASQHRLTSINDIVSQLSYRPRDDVSELISKLLVNYKHQQEVRDRNINNVNINVNDITGKLLRDYLPNNEVITALDRLNKCNGDCNEELVSTIRNLMKSDVDDDLLGTLDKLNKSYDTVDDMNEVLNKLLDKYNRVPRDDIVSLIDRLCKERIPKDDISTVIRRLLNKQTPTRHLTEVINKLNDKQADIRNINVNINKLMSHGALPDIKDELDKYDDTDVRDALKKLIDKDNVIKAKPRRDSDDDLLNAIDRMNDKQDVLIKLLKKRPHPSDIVDDAHDRRVDDILKELAQGRKINKYILHAIDDLNKAVKQVKRLSPDDHPVDNKLLKDIKRALQDRFDPNDLLDKIEGMLKDYMPRDKIRDHSKELDKLQQDIDKLSNAISKLANRPTPATDIKVKVDALHDELPALIKKINKNLSTAIQDVDRKVNGNGDMIRSLTRGIEDLSKKIERLCKPSHTTPGHDDLINQLKKLLKDHQPRDMSTDPTDPRNRRGSDDPRNRRGSDEPRNRPDRDDPYDRPDRDDPYDRRGSDGPPVRPAAILDRDEPRNILDRDDPPVRPDRDGPRDRPDRGGPVDRHDKPESIDNDNDSVASYDTAGTDLVSMVDDILNTLSTASVSDDDDSTAPLSRRPSRARSTHSDESDDEPPGRPGSTGSLSRRPSRTRITDPDDDEPSAPLSRRPSQSRITDPDDDEPIPGRPGSTGPLSRRSSQTSQPSSLHPEDDEPTDPLDEHASEIGPNDLDKLNITLDNKQYVAYVSIDDITNNTPHAKVVADDEDDTYVDVAGKSTFDTSMVIVPYDRDVFDKLKESGVTPIPVDSIPFDKIKVDTRHVPVSTYPPDIHPRYTLASRHSMYQSSLKLTKDSEVYIVQNHLVFTHGVLTDKQHLDKYNPTSAYTTPIGNNDYYFRPRRVNEKGMYTSISNNSTARGMSYWIQNVLDLLTLYNREVQKLHNTKFGSIASAYITSEDDIMNKTKHVFGSIQRIIFDIHNTMDYTFLCKTKPVKTKAVDTYYIYEYLHKFLSHMNKIHGISDCTSAAGTSPDMYIDIINDDKTGIYTESMVDFIKVLMAFVSFNYTELHAKGKPYDGVLTEFEGNLSIRTRHTIIYEANKIQFDNVYNQQVSTPYFKNYVKCISLLVHVFGICNYMLTKKAKIPFGLKYTELYELRSKPDGDYDKMKEDATRAYANLLSDSFKINIKGEDITHTSTLLTNQIKTIQSICFGAMIYITRMFVYA